MTKILVIEDDVTVKENVIDILQEESFQALDASNGLIGVKLAQEHQPDLILCDVRMPSMDGYEVLKRLKKNRATASIPFIFITSKTSRQSLRKGMDLGADDYLTKPFTPKELLRAIATRSNRQSIAHNLLTAEPWQFAGLKKIFEFDHRTNLPSRFALQNKFEELLQQHLLANLSNLAKSKKIGVKIPFFWIQIHNFADIQQSLAKDKVAMLPKVIAERLVVSTLAQGIVSYLDKGIFAVVIPSVKQKQEAVAAVNRIYQRLALPFRSNSSFANVILDTSIGISFYPDHGTNAYSLLEKAQCAAKVSNQNNCHYTLYKPNLQPQANYGNFLVRRDLSKAFTKQIQLTYQPQICLHTGKYEGCEAIMNWQHPRYGGLDFEQIMEIAKQAKIAQALNLWFWEQACKQLQAWQRQGLPKLKLTVKVAETHFYQDTFNLDVAKLIQKYQLGYGFLKLEIAEQTLLQDRQQALQKLNGLNNLGITVALNEFASGYSNLEYWRDFPISQINLNCYSLQQTYPYNRYKQIVQAAITLAHYARVKVTAKKVQTQSDWQLCKTHHCDFAQGSYQSKPLTAEEFTQFLVAKI